MIAADGGEARRLTDVPGDVTAIRWFPDSARLAFVTRVWAGTETWEAQREKMSARAASKMTAMVWDRPPIRCRRVMPTVTERRTSPTPSI